MSEYRSEAEVKGSVRRTRPAPLWQLVLLVAALLPSVGVILIFATVAVTNSWDPAHELGVSDRFLTGVLVALCGVLSGLYAGLYAKAKGRRLVLSPLVGAAAGWIVYLIVAALDPDVSLGNRPEMLATVLIVQGLAIVVILVAGRRRSHP